MSPAMTETAPETETSRWDYLLGTWRELDVPDGWRAEILDNGGIVLGAPPPEPHSYIAARVSRALYRVISEDRHVLQMLGIQIPVVERLFMPDLVVMSEKALLDRTRSPCPAQEAELVVEIVSRSSMDIDRKRKLWGYAHGPVPLYLLIDAWADAGPSVTLYEKPGNGMYHKATSVLFGESIQLPDPFGIELDTSRFPTPDQWPA